LGLFAGLLPGPPKRLSTLLLALCLKVNLPAALLATLYSNPLTILPLYFLAYSCGLLLLGDPAAGTMSQPPAWAEPDLWQWAARCLTGCWLLGWPLLLGLLVLGLTLSTWVVAGLGWRCAVVRNWKKERQHGLVEKQLQSAWCTRVGFFRFTRTRCCCQMVRASREYILHPGAVAILALTADRQLVMERQYRYPCRARLPGNSGRQDRPG
jgi:uncharacterized protein (DUF2062 family)